MMARTRTNRHVNLSATEEIIEEARNGRMFILVDDENRENEGDLIIPAQMATPDAINFMAKHGRGLVCLAMTQERVDQLGLQLMSPKNGTRHETAFTTSIEARDGVTTGISARDRARTVAVAINASKGREHIVTPGHIFPLIARPGGVLVRAGHTEAAVDIARLAGLNPSGVICEIMKEDGTMARLDDLVVFAQRHGLKIGTISDLIAYRQRHDHNLERVAETQFASERGGEWTAIAFRNKAIDTETLAIIKGRLDRSKPTLVRMHSLGLFEDALSLSGDRTGLLGRAMEAISAEGNGVIILLNPQIKLSQEVGAVATQELENVTHLRDYGVGAQILAELGIHDMILLTNSHHVLVALAGYGLNVVGERPLR
ncbi:3,4-dihydroxy-2-butanone-4-phosphate synthase [Novosphingobium resinovorum]|uniref:3,4-dihydroxy-2-butanone-4-phosphate synthase n=1 Tax=Novosphingobium resinovorum TaxID=158500 RepID=UPI002ED1D00A|nr:3,4-dihydroxy-2-butanone-4-phosphate synthase [Novosphingobium resinovorum]